MIFQVQFSKILPKANFCHLVLVHPFQCTFLTHSQPSSFVPSIQGKPQERAMTTQCRHQTNTWIRQSTAMLHSHLPSKGRQHHSGNPVPPFTRPAAQQTLLPAPLQSPCVTFTCVGGECQAHVLQMRPVVRWGSRTHYTEPSFHKLDSKSAPHALLNPLGVPAGPSRRDDGVLCSGERHPPTPLTPVGPWAITLFLLCWLRGGVLCSTDHGPPEGRTHTSFVRRSSMARTMPLTGGP